LLTPRTSPQADPAANDHARSASSAARRPDSPDDDQGDGEREERDGTTESAQSPRRGVFGRRSTTAFARTIEMEMPIGPGSRERARGRDHAPDGFRENRLDGTADREPERPDDRAIDAIARCRTGLG
jgi:hypothetical protein